jgi:hypothetical protein
VSTRCRKRRFYRYSSWVETTFERGGKEILLPLRARAVFRGRRVRGESEILVDGAWESHMVFPWCNLLFVPNEDQRNIFGETIADAIIEYFEQHDPEGLEELLAQSPVVAMPVELVL